MDEREPGQFERLLMLAFDGEADAAERAELSAWAEAEPRLAELADLRAMLVEALAVAGPVDVAGDVLAALDDTAWSPIGDALRDAVAAPPFSIADAIMADLPGMELSAFSDGELPDARVVAHRLEHDAAARETLAAWASIGHSLRQEVSAPVDVWPEVATQLGVAPDAVHGWDAVAAQVKQAFDELEKIDVSGAVMAAIEPRVQALPRWASLWVPIAGFAVAAALLLAVLPAAIENAPVAPLASLATPVPAEVFQLAAVNDAQVEDISGGMDVVVQVMQFDEGGPTFIMVDEEASL